MGDGATTPRNDTGGDENIHGFLSRAIKAADAKPSFSMESVDAAMEARGGETALAWRQRKEEFERSNADRQLKEARLDSLSLVELKTETITALEAAEVLLSETELDSSLRSHGWSGQLVSLLAGHCSELRSWVLEGTYTTQREGPTLGRWMIEEIDPRSTDSLKTAVFQAGDLLAAFARRQLSPQGASED
jgi:hypothetical protein